MDLRKQFFKLILKKAKKDKKIILLTGDLGFSFIEQFQKELPKQLVNCGCIEQSMIGIAAGMAHAGLKPYVYSNALFLLSRANEQIRDDICYNKEDVKLIGTGAAGFLGFSHNMAKGEDKNLIKSFPNIKGYWPNNEKELSKILFKNGASYIKI
jgi:transketolase